MRILFLTPAFFNYEKDIKTKLEQLGHQVVLYDERGVSSAFDKAMLRISTQAFNAHAKKYYSAIISKHRVEIFDVVLIDKADMTTLTVLNMLRNAFPKAKFVLYLSSSVKNNPGIIQKLQFFDEALSFDRIDCEKIKRLHFRPLYFSDQFANREKNAGKKYDICFCGTIHSDRYSVLGKIEQQAKELGLNVYKFYYLQARFMYYFYKLFGKGFKNAKMSEFAFEKKPLSELAEIEDASNVIIDIQHPAQTGLTMRTIEMIGLKKKIITTNADIKNYDFYNPANICVIDRENPVLDKAFFETPYEEIPKEIYDRYSLERWVKDVLGLEATK